MNATTVRQIKNLPSLQAEQLGHWPSSAMRIGAALLIVSLAIGYWSADGMQRLMHVYLLSVSFFLSISLGALFFVVLQHLTGARWSVVLRRIAELLTAAIPVLGLMMLPIVLPMFFGSAALYSWNDEALRQTDALVQGKTPYLNAPFFAFRCLAYFTLWTIIARFYFSRSVAQDRAADALPTEAMRKWSGPSMLAFAGTINFAAFDWLMSLDPHWFSTIFGIYFFAGCAVAVFATLAVASAILQRFGLISQAVTTEHYHDLGKLLFGFTFFWAYIAFSQFLLIWYANIPEETVWFLHRQEHGWQFVGLLLIVGHFFLPFFGLMSRSARRSKRVLLFWAVFMLAMHWIDLYWLIIPSASPESIAVGPLDLLTLVGVGGIWLATILKRAVGTTLVPVGDPYLEESLAFHNV